MPLRDVVRSSLLSGPILVVSLGILLAFGYVSPASAADTQVGAKVCGSNPTGAIVELTEPNDDSIVNQPVTTLRGTVTSASQVIVEVDGAYDSTVAIAANQTAFAVDVSLAEGTHTIDVRATEICGGPDGTDSIVITYTPQAEQPSNGGKIPTEVGGGGVTINPEAVVAEAISKEEVGNPLAQLPVIGGAVNMVTGFADTIGLTGTLEANNVPLITGTARVGLTVAAVTTVVMASSIAPVAMQAVPGITEVFNASSHRSMIYLEWVIRGVGVLALALAYFI